MPHSIVAIDYNRQRLSLLPLQLVHANHNVPIITNIIIIAFTHRKFIPIQGPLHITSIIMTLFKTVMSADLSRGCLNFREIAKPKSKM